MRRHVLVALTLIVLAAPAWAQHGALTVPRSLEQLTDRSADILLGTVVSAHVEKHPDLLGLDTVVVRLRVLQSLKGQARDTFTFRQYLWDLRDISGTGGYRKGQELLLLMVAPSAYGLSGPAGLEQGRFVVQSDRDGRAFAVNGRGNYRLFDGTGARLVRDRVMLAPATAGLVATHHEGPVELDGLMELIRGLVGQGQ